jgi:CheY-like chemotaxis protein
MRSYRVIYRQRFYEKLKEEQTNLAMEKQGLEEAKEKTEMSNRALAEANARLQGEIEKRRRAEEAYYSLAQNSLQGLLIMQDFCIVFANTAISEISGYAMESGNCFDVVILDLAVPAGMGGREAMQKLIEIDPGVRAIVSIGYSDDPIMTGFERYGFGGAIPKPYRIRELNELLREMVNDVSSA